jgi:hypothetical protein
MDELERALENLYEELSSKKFNREDREAYLSCFLKVGTVADFLTAIEEISEEVDESVNLIDKLEKLRRHHYECGDIFYSCPQSEEYLKFYKEISEEADECECGADIHNKILDEVIEEITLHRVKMKCPNCQSGVEFKKVGKYHAVVSCENCGQGWLGLMDSLEKIFG